MKNTFEGIVAVIGVIAIIALMCNPIMTGLFLVKVIEFIVILAVVNIITRALTGKSLSELLKSDK